MSRSLRRGAIAAVALAAILPLSACAAGNTPDTLQIKPDNASTSIGTTLKLNNIVVVTAPGASEEHPGPANVTVNISNSGSQPETLKSLELAEGGAATFTDAKGAPLSEVVIPAGGAVLLGGEDQPVARVATAKVRLGGNAPVSFTFGAAGKVAAEAQVHTAQGMYRPFGPSVAPKVPAAGASASASAGASATATASPSASAGASATASTPAAPPAASPSASAGAH
ncbi:DUF461 domain-containing protein [Kitasatospora sp. NPDC096147]|uniref:DUF461 domain-containing protein n=1 Tax=Kitasatospora sp. NPDC096147 TaxID=3364093 RepID=UPI003816BDCA